MAIMYPKSLAAYKPTDSERYFYEALKKELSDDYHVFFSVKWFTIVRNERVNSECDFLIFNSKIGYLTIELKGGIGIECNGDNWTLIMPNQQRDLNKSPYDQAEMSMRYFKDYYYETTNSFYKGVYGFAVAFPNFNVPEDLGPGAPKNLLIDSNDMANLSKRIEEIFYYWRGKSNNRIQMHKSQREKFISVVNKRISLSAASGALLEYKRNQFEIINRVQTNYLDLLSNYNQLYLIGGAGTGKTWIGLKKAMLDASKDMDVLLLCTSKNLADFLRKKVFNIKRITVLTISDIASKIEQIHGEVVFGQNYWSISEWIEKYYDQIKKYDSIVVDEAQDFNQDWAYSVRLLMKDEIKSNLYVLYDDAQNIYNRDFGDKFSITTQPFVLKENIRNTANIYNYAVQKTGLGNNVYPNTIEGVNPDYSSVSGKKSARSRIENILNTLIEKENVSNTAITIVSDVCLNKSVVGEDGKIANWNFVDEVSRDSLNEIRFKKIEDFKGLESDVIIFLRHNKISFSEEYVAYTRARFYLYEIEIKQLDIQK